MIESEQEFKALEAEVVAEDFEQEESSDDQPESRSEFMGAEQCSGLCHAVFAVVAGRKGEKWALNPAEAKALGGALDPVLAKYLPSVGQLSAETALLGALAAIILPRMMESEAQAQEGQGATVGDS